PRTRGRRGGEPCCREQCLGQNEQWIPYPRPLSTATTAGTPPRNRPRIEDNFRRLLADDRTGRVPPGRGLSQCVHPEATARTQVRRSSRPRLHPGRLAVHQELLCLGPTRGNPP